MELRSRSRSRTPFVQRIQQTELFAAEGTEYEETVVRTTRNTTIKSYETASSGNVTKTSQKTKISNKPLRRTTRHKTSDYSSEDGETEVTSRHVGENEKNQLIEDAKVAANGSSEISALGLYRKAGRYWDVYPKTDWTYSRSSRDRVELAPGVVAMPNMSRRSLHSQERSTDHLLTTTTTTTLPSTNSVKYRGRTLFTDDNYNDEYEYSSSVATSHRQQVTETTLLRRFLGVFWAVYTTLVSVVHRTVEYQGAWWLWLGKRVHRAASLLFLWDAWLLRVWDGRRRSSKVNGVLWLCLVPLLLFGGWYLATTLGQALLYGAYTNHTTTPQVHAHINNNQQQSIDLTQEQIERIALLINNREINTEPLKEEIERIKIELKELENSKNEDINRLLAQMKAENLRVMHSLRQCCRNSLINIETYVTRAVKDVFNRPEFTKDREDLAVWLRSIFVAKNDLENYLNNATQNLKSDFDAAIKTSGEKIMDVVAAKISQTQRVVVNTDSLSDEHVRNIVRDVLAVYDADKTGLVDFAMEPMGGQIITTKCTESYQAKTAVVSILGVPLWYPTNTPRTVITPGLNPGECWAFQNFPGFLVIKLAAPIKISAFSYEHISKKLIANGRIDSAPKDFEVYGLRNETDKEPLLLGQFRYDFNGESLQFFASAHYERVFEMIELRVLSNHGNPNYTCLYRFRVHGSVEPT